MIRKILGCILVSIPFVGIFILGLKEIGLKWTILAYIVAIIMVMLVSLGVHLIIF